MPITLATPYSPWPIGSPFEGVFYPKVRISQVNFLRNFIEVTVQLGDNPGGGEWTVAKEAPDPFLFVFDGEEFDALRTALTNDGEEVYDAVKRVIYEHLQTLNPIFLGTIE